MNRLPFVILMLCAPLAMAADGSYWVAIGSFQDAAVAERVVGEASSALRETFSVQQAQTSNGVVQRVATGPFVSREDAQAVQDQAKAGGYTDSWIFSRSTDDVTAESNLSRVLNDDRAGVDSSSALNAMENDLIDQPAAGQSQWTLQERLKTIKEVPTEIPPGYQLNQLYRDGLVPTPAKPE